MIKGNVFACNLLIQKSDFSRVFHVEVKIRTELLLLREYKVGSGWHSVVKQALEPR